MVGLLFQILLIFRTEFMITSNVGVCGRIGSVLIRLMVLPADSNGCVAIRHYEQFQADHVVYQVHAKTLEQPE